MAPIKGVPKKGYWKGCRFSTGRQGRIFKVLFLVSHERARIRWRKGEDKNYKRRKNQKKEVGEEEWGV